MLFIACNLLPASEPSPKKPVDQTVPSGSLEKQMFPIDTVASRSQDYASNFDLGPVPGDREVFQVERAAVNRHVL